MSFLYRWKKLAYQLGRTPRSNLPQRFQDLGGREPLRFGLSGNPRAIERFELFGSGDRLPPSQRLPQKKPLLIARSPGKPFADERSDTTLIEASEERKQQRSVNRIPPLEKSPPR